MFLSLELINSIAVHLALFLACLLYAAFLAQPMIYKAYHPHNTIFTVIGGEALIGIAFGIECILAGAWIRTEPIVAAGFFFTLHIAAMIPIWRWQRKQAREEKAREDAIEARLAARGEAHGD